MSLILVLPIKQILLGMTQLFRFNIDNLFNKKYWRDVGAFMGDDYLFLGNPRTAQFSTTFSF